MNLDEVDLAAELEKPRAPNDSELNERISRAILRWLRHGATDLHQECFALFQLEQFAIKIEKALAPKCGPGFRTRLQSNVEQLVELEKIELRGDKIRALYGHSLRGIIVGRMKWPEIPLFHATSQRHLDSILEHGLRPQGRTWVHLTSQTEYANRICKHHSFDGPAVMLQVDARRLKDHDVTFRQPNSHVWLANHVPPVGILVCEPNGHSEIDKRI